jgi:hypothetical protein
LLRILADFDLSGSHRNWPEFSLSGPFFSPNALAQSGPKSTKRPDQPIVNQQVTSGRIKRLILGIGSRRKPLIFGEWRMPEILPIFLDD